MKFLVITDYKSGGAGHVAENTGAILSEQSNMVNYLYGSDFYKFNIKNYMCNIDAYKLIKQKLSEYNPDVIMLHNFDNILSPLILLAIRNYKNKVKVIMTVHDYHIISASNSLSYFKGRDKYFFNKLPTFFDLLKYNLDRRGRIYGFARLIQWYTYYNLFHFNEVIDHYICPSQFIYNKCLKRIDNKKLNVIYNPTSFSLFNCSSSKRELKGLLTISFVGRVSLDKGIYQFIKAIYDENIIFNDMIEINIIGDGDFLPKLNDLKVELNNNNVNLNLYGKMDQSLVALKLNASDYVLLPSVCYENAPLSLVEGVFSGCKIITMNYGGMVEIASKITGSITLDDFSRDSLINMKNILEYNGSEPINESEKLKFIKEYSNSNYMESLSVLLNN